MRDSSSSVFAQELRPDKKERPSEIKERFHPDEIKKEISLGRQVRKRNWT